MSKFHESVRDILQDVNRFLVVTLQHERLSASAMSQQETILMKLTHLTHEYPQLRLALPDKPSPPPYVDMNRNSVDYSLQDEHYEACDQHSESPHQDTSSETQSAETYSPLLIKDGYLEKKGKDGLVGLLTAYQRRWTVIDRQSMVFYHRPGDARQIGQIELVGYEARPLDTANGRCFELVCPGKKTYQFMSADAAEMLEWVEAVETVNRMFAGDDSMCSSLASPEQSLRHQSLPPDLSHLTPSGHDDEEQIYHDGDLPAHSAASSTDDTAVEVEDPDLWYLGVWDCPVTPPSDPDVICDLPFSRGDLLHVISKLCSDWWLAELGGNTGLVPSNYLTEAYEVLSGPLSLERSYRRAAIQV